MLSYDVCECGAAAMNRPTPKPTGTEVLLKVTAAGICDSDLDFGVGILDLGSGKTLRLTDRGTSRRSPWATKPPGRWSRSARKPRA